MEERVFADFFCARVVANEHHLDALVIALERLRFAMLLFLPANLRSMI